ncbi:MAG: hypothetical protein NC819_02760 [Candidatus Omnitrophica bacterium]|nr:hypothetical protein [Candidatus Omnitrophota bacterium]
MDSFPMRLVSAVLTLTSVVTWATPGFALRPVVPQESGERANLEMALREAGGLPSGTPTPSTVADQAGLEEWHTIPQAELPADLFRDLMGYGMLLEKAEYIQIRPSDNGGPAVQPFAHVGTDVVIPMSVNQAVGSYLFKGMGKSYKVLADGNAVFMGFHSLIDYTLRHPNEALLVLGDEGDRDSSIALRTGSIFFRGAVIPFKDMATLRAVLKDFLGQEVRVRGIIGDALEVTNDFVEGRPNSWGVATIVDIPQNVEEIEKLALIPDNLRRAGWVYYAPRPAKGLTPWTLPEEGFKLIAEANDVDVENPTAYAEWMSKRRQTTLHGNRSFLAPARSQGERLAASYPGFRTYFPNDGDLFPAVLAAMGMNEYTATRHGSNEGHIADVAVNNVKNAHFVHTYVSAKSTEKAASLTPQTGHNFVPEERALAAGFGITTDKLTAIDTRETWPHRGVIAMSSVTGTSVELAGILSALLKEVEFRPDPEGALDGRVIVNTFVLAQDGSAYVVRTTLWAYELEEAKEWIKLASRLPSPVPPPSEKPAKEAQTLATLIDVVAQPNISAVNANPGKEVSRTFRYVLPNQLAELLTRFKVGYHLSFLHPGQIGSGSDAEFYRTRGHFHSQPVGELVEIYNGKGSVLLWKAASSTSSSAGVATDAVRLSVKTGDKFFVPAGWAHLTVNEDPQQMLVFGTWLRQDVQLNHEALVPLRGGPWYIGPAGYQANPNYSHVPELALRVPNKEYIDKTLGIPSDRSVWSIALTDPERFKAIMGYLTQNDHPALESGNLFSSAATPVAGLEENTTPVIGWLQPPAAERTVKGQARLLRQAVGAIVSERKQRSASGQSARPLFGDFDYAFGQLLRQTGGNMNAFSEIFLNTQEFYQDRNMASHQTALLDGVRRIAQDPGAPHNKPPITYFNPARYTYVRLRQPAFDGFVRDVLDLVVKTAQTVIGKTDLSDLPAKAAKIQELQKLIDPKRQGRITAGPYQYEIFYDSIVQKEGETYLTLELLLDGEKDYHQGVVLELQVVIPPVGRIQQYRGPYPLKEASLNSPYSVGLLDPIHFINNRFPEWGPKTQRDIYESRIHTLKASKGAVKRQYIRPSTRQGNNPRFFEPFFRSFLAGDVPFVYHIVDALASERDYGNQGGVGSVGNLASAIVRRGGIGPTASWLIEDPATAAPLVKEGRTLVYSYEKDHHRIDNIKDVKGFASELEPFLAAYWENLITGWPSANLQDETKFIVQRVRDPWMTLAVLVENGVGPITDSRRRVLEQYTASLYGSTDLEKAALKAVTDKIKNNGAVDAAAHEELRQRAVAKLEPVLGARDPQAWLDLVNQVAQTGVIDDEMLRALEAMYMAPVGQGLPSSLGMHWLRNRFFRHVVDSIRAQGIKIAPFSEWYIEPDYALDGKPHTVEEMAYLTMMSWISAQAHGHKLGPVVPSYGNVHGADAGDPSLVLAGVLQYAAQAATVYGEPLALSPDILAIARKAPHGYIALARTYAGAFGDKALAKEFVAVVESAGERTAAEEERLHRFVLEQLQKIPADVLKALKQAERQRRLLSEVAPGIAQQLDDRINALSLDRRAAITTHAASGLSAEQLAQAREVGVWVANKSTEFQNIITKILQVVYLLTADPAQAQAELQHLPAAKAVLQSHPLTPGDLAHTAQLYTRMYQAAARALKDEKDAKKKELIQQALQDPKLPFPWFWRDNLGWSMTDPAGTDWKKKMGDWGPGAHGRYMFSMRDKMVGSGIDGTLLFPNELAWGLPEAVIKMAQKEIERTIRFYHQQSMNAEGGAAEYRHYVANKTAGLEEENINQAVQGLDAPDEETRLQSIRELRKLETQGVSLPVVGPILPSYIHVHTDRSYPELPGTFSATHMIWAAHQADAREIFLVDHETVAHIREGFEAAKIVNEGDPTPLKPIFGVEFRAPVDPSRIELREALQKGVGRGPAAWVVGMGVPVDGEGNFPAALGQLVARFQGAKEVRGNEQVLALASGALGLKVAVSREKLESLVVNRNVTERQLSFDIARAELGVDAAQEAVTKRASQVRAAITQIPYRTEAGFLPYEETVRRLAELGMIPTFTMQVSVSDLQRLLPELRGLGIQALDLSGIESHHANAVSDIETAIRLAQQNRMLVVGGVDYRGTGAIGWPQAANWMRTPEIGLTLLAVRASAQAGLSAELRSLALRSAGFLIGSDRPVEVNTSKTQVTVYPHLATPLSFLHWLADGQTQNPQVLVQELIRDLIQGALKEAGVPDGSKLRVVNTLRFGGKENLTREIERVVPSFAPPVVDDAKSLRTRDIYDSAGLEESNLKRAIQLGSTFSFDFFENISDALIDAAIAGGATEFTMNPYSTGNYIQHLLVLTTPEGRAKARELLAVRSLNDFTAFKQKLGSASPAVQKAIKAALEPSPDVKPETELVLARTMIQSMLEESVVVSRMLRQLIQEKKSDEEAYWAISKYFADKIAKKIFPFFQQSNGATGYVSIEVDPRIEREEFAASQAGTVQNLKDWMIQRMQKEAGDLKEIAPNILVKAPATEAGIATIRNVNAHFNTTLAFADDDAKEAIAAHEARADAAHRLRISPFVSRNAVYFDEFWGPLLVKADNTQDADGHVATICNTYDMFVALGGTYAPGAIWSSLGMKVKGDPGELYAKLVVGIGILNAPPETARDFNRAQFTVERLLGVKTIQQILTAYFQEVKEGKIPSAKGRFKALMEGQITPEVQAELAYAAWQAARDRQVDLARLEQVLQRIAQLEQAANKPVGSRKFTREAVAKAQVRVQAGEVITEKELMRMVLKAEGEEKFIIPFQGAIDALGKAMKQIREAEAARIQAIARRSEYSRFKDWQIIYKAKSGHPGGTLSAVEIVETLYDPDVLRLNPNDRAVPIAQRWLNRDRVVLSKGHAVPIQYVALMNAGILTPAQVEDLRQDAKNFAQGHATLSVTPGIDFSTGALGYGAPAAAGMAVAARMDGRDFHTFTIIGDGEMEKGPIYEMAQAARMWGLDNLTVIIDYNQYQQNMAREKYTPLDFERLTAFWKGMDWNVAVIDGENMADNEKYIAQLRQSLIDSKTVKNGKPTVILVRTIKGRGISSVEELFRKGDTSYHGKAPDAALYEKGVREIAARLSIPVENRPLADLEADLEKVGEQVRQEIRARQLTPEQIAEIDRQNGISSQAAWQQRLGKQVVPLPTYTVGQKVATREATGAAWIHYASLQSPIPLATGGTLDPTRIVLVSPSDLQDSENFVGFGKTHGIFSPQHPHGRLVLLGIMEDAGAKVAEGIAATGLGYLPVIGTFDRFVELILAAINHAAQDNLALVVNASHSGSETGADGTSQYSIETPVMMYAQSDYGQRVAMFEPSDAVVTLDAARQALSAGKVAYIRVGRNPRPVLDHGGKQLFDGAVVHRNPPAGSRRVILVASGATVAHAIDASRFLQESEGISAKVVEVTSVTRVDDPVRDNPLLQVLEPGVPVYTIHDASVLALRQPVQQAIDAAVTLNLFPALAGTQRPRLFSRGITVTGSGSTENLFGHNRFLPAQIAEDVKLLLTALEQNNPAAIPAGIMPRLASAGLEEESHQVVEAKAAVSTAEKMIVSAEREGDGNLAGIHQLELINAQNNLSRLTAPQIHSPDSGPIIVLNSAGLEGPPPVSFRRFQGLFEEGRPDRLTDDPFLASYVRVGGSTLVAELDSASDVSSVGRIFQQDGAILSDGLRQLTAQNPVVDLPTALPSAQELLSAESISPADLALLAPSAFDQATQAQWNDLFVRHRLAAVQITPDAVADLDRLSARELAVFLNVVLKAGGLRVILGVEVQEKTTGERYLFIHA